MLVDITRINSQEVVLYEFERVEKIILAIHHHRLAIGALPVEVVEDMLRHIQETADSLGLKSAPTEIAHLYHMASPISPN